MLPLAVALKPFAGQYSPAFLRAVSFVLEHECEFQDGHEGDYSKVATEHDPRDPGGATRYGIDERSHPGVDVARITLADALQIYALEWTHLRGDDLPPKVALVLFDSAVNCGTGRAARWLQTLCALPADGVIGDRSVDAASESRHPGWDKILAGRLIARREAYYHDLPPRLRTVFLRGWLARLSDLRVALLT